jgi:hypothetical protein
VRRLRPPHPLARGNDVSFIDAAHLIPFAESRNDHPTNGLALCKNHHWAMDRNLIAPCPDHHWQVSKILDPRRSTGEAELLGLSGRSLLLPQDVAFQPDVEDWNGGARDWLGSRKVIKAVFRPIAEFPHCMRKAFFAFNAQAACLLIRHLF